MLLTVFFVLLCSNRWVWNCYMVLESIQLFVKLWLCWCHHTYLSLLFTVYSRGFSTQNITILCRIMTTRLRHRPQTEEEDASALKLGPGTTWLIHCIRAIDLSALSEFNNAGCLLISEVKYLLENRDKDAPDTAYVYLIVPFYALV